jgi:hypothetical protein
MKREINYLSAALVGAAIALTMAFFLVYMNGEPPRSLPRYAGNATGGALMACGIAWLINRTRRTSR